MIRPLVLHGTEEAHRELERIGVDPGGIARMLPKLELQIGRASCMGRVYISVVAG